MFSFFLPLFISFLLPIASYPTTENFVIPKIITSGTSAEEHYKRLLIAFRSTLSTEGGPSDPMVAPITKKPTNVFGRLPLPLQTQTEMALELMAALDAPPETDDERALFSPETWHSLRIIDQEPSALGGIAPAMKTIFGKLYLARMLTTPSTDIERIKSRQKAIKELCKNPQFNSKIAKLCGKIQPLQEQLLGLTSIEHPIYEKGLRIYLHDFFLRSIKPSARIWNRFSKTFGDFWYLAGPLLGGIGTILAWKKYVEKFHASGADKDAHVDFLGKKFNAWQSAAALAAISGYMGGIQIPGIVTWIKQRDRAMDYFYEQLLPLKKFYIITATLKKKLELCPSLKSISNEIDTALSLNDPNIIKLRKLLMGPAFRGKLNRFLFGGDLILAIDLMKTCRPIILKGIGLLGALDTYSTLASWYNQYLDHKNTPLCFAHFKVNEERPSIELIDFWHVLTQNKPILNSLTLGDNKPKNGVIFGIFESGKSTILQAVALNVLCAQSIGICLARKYTATPYASINIYANIKDDLANDRSLFKTELYRALQLLDQIKTMPEGSFSFTIADATFTGTEAGAGQAAAYAIARYLGQLPNSISLHATNFLSLSILGTQEPQKFKNYYLPTVFDKKTIQTYKLTEGSQSPQLSTKIFAEEGMPQEIITEMENQLASMGINYE